MEIKGYDPDTEAVQVLATVTAPKLHSDKVYPKEKELIDLVRNEVTDNRKVLIYVSFTGSRDIRPRIQKLLEDRGYRVGILSDLR